MAYIDVDKFAEKICNFQAIDEDSANAVIYLLRSQPTADVEEVKHGIWLEKAEKIPNPWDEGGYSIEIDYVCSECGFINALGKTNGCPYCLAKMDGGNNNDL